MERGLGVRVSGVSEHAVRRGREASGARAGRAPGTKSRGLVLLLLEGIKLEMTQGDLRFEKVTQ